MKSDTIKAMLEAAAGANHVGEYPEGNYSPMPNNVGTIHAVSDLQQLLALNEQLEQVMANAERLRELSNKLIAQVDRALDFDLGNHHALKGSAYALDNALSATAHYGTAMLLANAFERAAIPKSAKAGCIGEFSFVIENGRVCPVCYNDGHSKECELCNGESGEDGSADLTVTVPWDTCKEIWLAMNKFAAMDLRRQADSNG